MARINDPQQPAGSPAENEGRTPAAAETTNLPAKATETEQSAAQAPAQSLEIMQLQNARALEEFDDPFASVAAYRHFQTVAQGFANSQFVPDHFRGKPNDCLIAMNIAKRMGEDPLMVIQNMFVVKGTPGFKTQFMIARANRNAGFKASIRWEIRRDLTPAMVKGEGGEYPNVEVTAWTLDRFGQKIEATVGTTMAVAEKWVSNAKYRTMLEHMLMWRSAAFLIRLYSPEVMMGYSSVDELQDMAAAEGSPLDDVARTTGTAALLAKISGDSAAKAPGLPVIDVTATESPSSPASASPAPAQGAGGSLFDASGK